MVMQNKRYCPQCKHYIDFRNCFSGKKKMICTKKYSNRKKCPYFIAKSQPKHKFNFNEEKIIKILYNTKVSLTAYEIAKLTQISYPTAKNILTNLEKEKIVSCFIKGTRKKCKVEMQIKEYKFNFVMFRKWS